MQLSDYILQVQTLVHDLAGNDYTTNELTNYVNNARTRTALDSHCVRTLFGPPPVSQPSAVASFNLIPNQEIYPINGGIPGTILTAGGTGYSGAPSITIAAPVSGIQATATCTILGGSVNSITITNWGSGYPAFATPTLTFSGGAAQAVTVPMAATIDIKSITYLWPGSTNRQVLRWLPWTTFQAWCRAYTGQIGSPSAWTTHDGANLIYIFPIPDQAYLLEMDIIARPPPLVNTTDTDTAILDPFNDCVQYYAAFIARTKLQDYEKADYWRKYYNTRVREVNATRIDARIPNVYRSSARRMMRW